MKKIKIAIILPGPAYQPVGGYKIIYDYFSNFDNFEISYIYPLKFSFFEYNFIKNSKFFCKKIFFKYILPEYYKWANNKLKKQNHRIVYRLNEKILKEYDLIIATSVETAIEIKKFNINNIPVIYFIQHFENWNVSKEKVIETYHYGFYNIVVSKWLKDILIQNNCKVNLYLPNPVDDDFYIKIPITKRNPKSIIFMYHKDEWKGSKEAIEIANILKHKFRDIEISCFSRFNKPGNLPNYINFFKSPSRVELNNLFNKHFIYLFTSYKEGFGLPPAEAMKAGCLIVGTKAGGNEEFCIDKKTSILLESPPKVDLFVNKIEKIFIDKKTYVKSLKIAENGNKYITEYYDFNKNMYILEEFINNIIRNK